MKVPNNGGFVPDVGERKVSDDGPIDLALGGIHLSSDFRRRFQVVVQMITVVLDCPGPRSMSSNVLLHCGPDSEYQACVLDGTCACSPSCVIPLWRGRALLARESPGSDRVARGPSSVYRIGILYFPLSHPCLDPLLRDKHQAGDSLITEQFSRLSPVYPLLSQSFQCHSCVLRSGFAAYVLKRIQTESGRNQRPNRFSTLPIHNASIP